jgi:MYXO-CTERM domain-containing protein
MLITTCAAAIIATIGPIEGEVIEDGGDYAIVEFEVTAEHLAQGAVEMTITRVVDDDSNILDFGVWAPGNQFRGWGGGLTEPAVIGEADSSRGYVPGPLVEGTWQIVIGKAQLRAVPAGYSVTIEIHDVATLTPRPRATYEGAAIAAGPRWYAGDLHVHSAESGDASASFDDITSLARNRGIDFVVLSDHNTVSQHGLIAAFQDPIDDVLFVRGNEVTTYSGHGNALGAGSYIDHRLGLEGRTAADLVGEVASAGGYFVVNHPKLTLGAACIGCEWEAEPTPWEQVTAMEILTGPFVIDNLIGKPARDMWDELLDEGHRITAVAGSDDHRAGIDFDPGTQSPIGSPTTLVYADELSEAAILEGIAEGRVVVLLSGPDDPRVEIEIDSDSGELGRIGDTIRGQRLTIRARVTGGDGARAVLVTGGNDGETRAIEGSDAEVSWEVEAPESGARYRVHVVGGEGLVTVTNHVFVDFAAAPGGGGCGCQSGGSGGGPWLALLALALAFVRRR